MRVEIERETPTRRWKVWVLDEFGGRLRVMDSEGEWLEALAGEVPSPTWVIDEEVWRPLTAAILGLPTDQAPLADHLNDTRQVRDRLLALVEHLVEPPRFLPPPGESL